MSNNKCWSSSGDWFEEDLDYVLEYASEDLADGDVFTISEGDAFKPNISEFVHADCIMESICENAFDNRGEYCEGWISCVENISPAEYKKLEDQITSVIRKWLQRNNCEINFYDVKNIREVTWEVIDGDNQEFEEI